MLIEGKLDESVESRFEHHVGITRTELLVRQKRKKKSKVGDNYIKYRCSTEFKKNFDQSYIYLLIY